MTPASLNDKGGEITFELNGDTSANLFGIFKSDVSVSMNADFGIDATKGVGFYVKSLGIAATGKVKVLIIEADVALSFDYADGAVQSLSGKVGVELNWYVGYLRGWVSFDYDPANPQSGSHQNDLAITVGGTISIDLWIDTVKISMSETVYIDASFLGSSDQYPPSLPPILDLQVVHSGELCDVVGNHDAIVVDSVGGNEYVHRPNRGSGSLKVSADLGVSQCVRMGEGQDIDQRQDIVHVLTKSGGVGLVKAKLDLCHDDQAGD